jgi:hypothetical protein
MSHLPLPGDQEREKAAIGMLVTIEDRQTDAL